MRTSSAPATTITITTSTIVRTARPSVSRSTHDLDARARSAIGWGYSRFRSVPPRCARTRAERLAKRILEHRPGALLVFDTR